MCSEGENGAFAEEEPEPEEDIDVHEDGVAEAVGVSPIPMESREDEGVCNPPPDVRPPVDPTDTCPGSWCGCWWCCCCFMACSTLDSWHAVRAAAASTNALCACNEVASTGSDDEAEVEVEDDKAAASAATGTVGSNRWCSGCCGCSGRG